MTMWFLLFAIAVFGQDKGDLNLLETDSSWNQEIFHFPIPFAPEINFEGFEDARFPEDWSKKDSSDFWSYVFVWCINDSVEITSSGMEDYIQIYFNGLMNCQNTVAVFFEKESINTTKKFEGKIKTLDALVTKENMTLYVSAEHFYCDESKTTYLVFRFSPQEFEGNVWNKLNQVKLRKQYL